MIPVNTPDLTGNEARYLAECIETGWISSEGPFVQRLEQGVAKLSGRRHGIAVANGTVAIDVALAALGLGAGDEVILPSFTIISCAAGIVRAGAIPVVVDSDPATWNMDVSRIEAKITARTRAIMAVHIYGLPVDMDPLLELARKHGLDVIEDAAEAIGQQYKGRPCGSLGRISTLSFYPNKHITTGEGGMVLTDDDALAARCRDLRNLCFGRKRRFVHEELGWNFRMSNLQAAVGVAQLERIEASIRRKREIGRRYLDLLGGLPRVRLPLPSTAYAENIFWVFGLVLEDGHPIARAAAGGDTTPAEVAMKRLAEKGVGTRPFFWGMHEQPVFRKMGLFAEEACPVAAWLGRNGFYVPGGLALTDGEVTRAAAACREVLQ